MRVALYLRVSTDDQTVENQRQALQLAASTRGWTVTHTFADEGISGAKRSRPGFDAMLQAAARHEFDVVAAWSLDRLGRSVLNLSLFLSESREAGVALYLHQQQIDTSTAAGRMMFSVLGSLAEYERELIIERTKAGMSRARSQGKRIGSPAVLSQETRRAISAMRGQMSARAAAAAAGVSKSHVHRLWQAA